MDYFEATQKMDTPKNTEMIRKGNTLSVFKRASNAEEKIKLRVKIY